MPLDPNRPSPQADLNARFQERVGALEAGGTLATDLTAPAPTADSASIAPAVAAPSAAIPAEAPAGTPAAAVATPPGNAPKIPASGAHAPDAPTANASGPATAAIAKPASPADAVLGTPSAAPAAAADAVPAVADAAGAAATPAEPEWVDVTVESGIPDVSYTFRAPKGQEDQIKRGFLREGDYTKKTMALGKYREFLTPLVQPDPANGGRTAMDVLQPLLQRAMTDNAFGARMTELFRRAVNGQPMFFSDEVAPGATPSGNGHVPAAAAPPAQGEITLESLGFNPEDPWLEGQLPALRKLVENQNALQQYVNSQQQQQQTQAQTMTQREQVRQEGNRARAFMESKYPGEYEGPPGSEQMQRSVDLYNYAIQQGYIASTGSIAGGMLAARVDFDRARTQQQQNQIGSPAAKSLAQAELEAQQLAQNVTGRVAATVAPPNGATTPGAVAPAKVALRNADGSRRNPKQIIAEAAQAALAGAAR